MARECPVSIKPKTNFAPFYVALVCPEKANSNAITMESTMTRSRIKWIIYNIGFNQSSNRGGVRREYKQGFSLDAQDRIIYCHDSQSKQFNVKTIGFQFKKSDTFQVYIANINGNLTLS